MSIGCLDLESRDASLQGENAVVAAGTGYSLYCLHSVKYVIFEMAL